MKPIRLKSYTTFFADGKSSVKINHRSKRKRVFVALVLGDEPLVLEPGREMLDAEQAIIDLANHIKRSRRAAAARGDSPSGEGE